MGSSSGWLARWTRTARSAPRPVAAVLLGSLVLACGDPEPEAQPEAQAQPEPTAPTPAAQPRQPEGELKIGGAGTLPEGFPADVPIYPGAESTRWMSGLGAGAIVAFKTGDPPSAVYDFYRERLPQSGWAIESASSAAGHWQVSAEKGGTTARVSIGVSGEGSDFGIALVQAD